MQQTPTPRKLCGSYSRHIPKTQQSQQRHGLRQARLSQGPFQWSPQNTDPKELPIGYGENFEDCEEAHKHLSCYVCEDENGYLSVNMVGPLAVIVVCSVMRQKKGGEKRLHLWGFRFGC